MTTHDRPGRAAGLLTLGILSGVALDICGKWFLETYSLTQFVFLRSVFGAALLLLIAPIFGGRRALATRRLGWHLLRSLLATGAMFGFFYGVANIRLVDALTISFVAPIFTTVLAGLLLRDAIGWRRSIAIFVGFIGVLIVLRPGSGVISLASIAVLASAFFYACLAITARHLAGTENSFALSLYVLIGPLIVGGLLTPNEWQAPSSAHWGLFALAGALSVGAWLGIVGAYRRASPALLAPLEYTALIWAALGGYLIWNEVPDQWVYVGGAVIVSSGLFIGYREMGRRVSGRYLRSQTAAATAQPPRTSERD